MPRTFRRLWEPFISFENLNLAWRNARRGKRRKPAVAAFEWAAESHLFDLQDELTTGTYQHQPYHTFVVTEHGKRRLISAAHFRDRVVHHALAQLRTYLRLSYELQLIGEGGYAHGSRLVNDVGRVVGTWRRTLAKPAAELLE